MMDHRFIIGIDLGTTNSAVYSADLSAESPSGNIRLFRIPQLTGPGEINRLPVLPSFGYIAGEYDIRKEALRMPWTGESETDFFVGAFARDHGSRVPSRLISSAKSWLCHAHVDRKARILPWGSGTNIAKMSPVQTTAAYLQHIRFAWNHTHAEDESNYLEHQFIVLTVPASFDESARELTMEAATAAGLPHVTLLEEPLAAFYSFLHRHESDWRNLVNPGELILVCDVGGGTTDFSLITLKEADGSPRFERIAVGDHLILGGDNIDLTLARWVERKVGKSAADLSGDRWKTLCHQCRQAKERILNGSVESAKITLMGTGGKLIDGTVSAELDRETIEALVMNGFFPLVDPTGILDKAAPKGISEFGLPYETEPAITRHLGWFLEKHRRDVTQALQKDSPFPDCILFNGGSLKPLGIRERIREALRKWFGVTDTRLPRMLENPDPDLAVAMGAAYYGMVRMGRGVRVGSGSPRSVYLGVEASSRGTERQAVCLVERGMEEGTTYRLSEREFRVRTNTPVAFEIYSSSYRSGDRRGDVLSIDDSFTPLPPLQTIVQYGKKGLQADIPVEIEAGFTETGILALWCRSRISDHKWKLHFQLRGTDQAATVMETDVFDTSLIRQAQEVIQEEFSQRPGTGVHLDSLPRKIAEIVGQPKEKWPLGLLRSLADTLLSVLSARTHSMRHEARWLNLTGFCLRPGFGDGNDPNRLKQLWKISKAGPRFSNHPQVRSEWWILWRRVGAGLTAGQQKQFLQDISPLLFPGKTAKSRIAESERMEVWMAAANLERIASTEKIKLGRTLLNEIQPGKAKPQQFWAIGRIGAREPWYGTADRVIPASVAMEWIHHLLEQPWSDPSPVASAVIQLARKTGDRTRDIDSSRITAISGQLVSMGTDPEKIRRLEETIPIHRQDAKTIFGEDLPAGLLLE